MEFAIPIEIIAFLAITLGVICRTYFPYLKKLDENRQNEDFVFELRYVVTMIVSGIVTAIFVYPTFIIPEGSQFQVFIAGFVFAWGANDAINYLIN